MFAKRKLHVKTLLKRHILSTHSGLKFPCQKCDYEATNASNLRSHELSVLIGRKLKCPFCDYQANQNRYLSAHMNIKSLHLGIIYPFKTTKDIYLKAPKLSAHKGRTFQWSKCDYQSKGRSGLATHKETVHMGIQVFVISVAK